MSFETLLLAVVGSCTAVVALLFVMLILVYLLSDPFPDLTLSEKEKIYLDPQEGYSPKPFYSLKANGNLDLSVIVPAYNEELRLPIMMDEAMGFLEDLQKKDKSFTYEVIVVDDGSRDSTTKVALEYSEKFGTNKVRVLTLQQNRGKGGAIRSGVLSCRGKWILFADADGATTFSCYSKLAEQMKVLVKLGLGNSGVVVGSRAHLAQESVVKRSIFRTFLMYGFHFLVWFTCVRSIKDTQCGFKLFTRSSARLLFCNMHVERWAFDVELLYLAELFKVPLAEVAVDWQEIDGSKLIPVFSWLQMFKDIILVRLRYMLGAWKVERKYEWN